MRVAEIEKQVADRFSKLDDKITVIYDKVLSNHILMASKSVESRLLALEERLDIINDKIDNLPKKDINNNIAANFEEEQELLLNAIESMNLEFASRMNDILLSMEDMNKKIEQNKNLLDRNLNEVLGIKENLHTKNIRQERKEFGHDLDRQTELINELLSLVKNKLKARVVDDHAKLNREDEKAERSITLTTIPQKKQRKSNNQTLASKLTSTRKSGIFYPNTMKNVTQPPPVINNLTTFFSDRDIKVII